VQAPIPTANARLEIASVAPTAKLPTRDIPALPQSPPQSAGSVASRSQFDSHVAKSPATPNTAVPGPPAIAAQSAAPLSPAKPATEIAVINPIVQQAENQGFASVAALQAQPPKPPAPVDAADFEKRVATGPQALAARAA